MSQLEDKQLNSHDRNDAQFTSEFSYLYKNVGKNSEISQQDRREIFLREQKEKRHNVVDKHRDFSQLFVEDEGDWQSDISEPLEDMDVDAPKPHKYKYKFALMLSEWLTEVPTDLEENWFVKLAPHGFRVLVIAKKCRTVVLNEKGKVLTLKTHLPGGGLSRGHGLTVLDCIYNKHTKMLFVLDCLFWNTMSMVDSDTMFRFYWLKNQFSENAKLIETDRAHKFHVLDFFPAEKSLIQNRLFEDLVVSNEKVLNTGVVFYHKELQYVFAQTPLLGWLYSYMLPEKLGIDVPQELMDRMPKDYENVEKYLETLEQRQLEKKGRGFYRDRREERKKMDVS